MATSELMGQRRWIAGHYLHHAWERSRDAWKTIPREGRRRWLVAIASGWGALLALVATASLVGRATMPERGYAWERSILRGASEWPLSFVHGIWLDSLGSIPFMVPIVLLSAVLAARQGQPRRAMSMIAAYLVPGLALFVGWALWHRPRPTLVVGELAESRFPSFPSGHVAEATCFYGYLALSWMGASRSVGERFVAAGLALVVVAAVSISRLRLGAHYPTDVIAGVVMGLGALAVLVVADRRSRR